MRKQRRTKGHFASLVSLIIMMSSAPFNSTVAGESVQISITSIERQNEMEAVTLLAGPKIFGSEEGSFLIVALSIRSQNSEFSFENISMNSADGYKHPMVQFRPETGKFVAEYINDFHLREDFKVHFAFGVKEEVDMALFDKDLRFIGRKLELTDPVGTPINVFLVFDIPINGKQFTLELTTHIAEDKDLWSATFDIPGIAMVKSMNKLLASWGTVKSN